MKETNLTVVYRRKLLRLIEESPMTIQQAADATGLAYNTVARYLVYLAHHSKIKVSHSQNRQRVYVPFDAPNIVIDVASKKKGKDVQVATQQPAETEMQEPVQIGGIMTRWIGGNPFKKAMA